jgi:urease accessory protein
MRKPAGVDAQTALLQLASPGLPIGGYSYSQGLEAAVACELVHDEDTARAWIREQLLHVMAHCEAPAWLLLFDAWSQADYERAARWNAWFHASRETRELRRETEQRGWSLASLANELSWGGPALRAALGGLPVITLPAAHACCACALELDRHDALAAYLFTWVENQVMAAIKTIPLGQLAGQRILDDVRRHVGAACGEAAHRADASPPKLDTLAPQLAILSARHETQYSRLFRS